MALLGAQAGPASLVDDSTYEEYLQGCHRFLFQRLPLPNEVNPDPSRPFTIDVTGKQYPQYLKPWPGFVETQRRSHDIISNMLQDTRLLPSQFDLASRSNMALNTLRSEIENKRAGPERFVRLAIEAPVEKVYSVFCPLFRSPDDRIGFEDQIFGLQEPDSYHDTEERLFVFTNGSSGSQKWVYPRLTGVKRKGPHRWCTRTGSKGEKETAFPVECVGSHNISEQRLRSTLCKDDLFVRVVARHSSGQISVDKATRWQEHVEMMVAKALAQTFHYMIRLGSRYGLLTFGKSLIFLSIAEDPRTLRYHMTTTETQARCGKGAIDPFHTAVAQLGAFVLQTAWGPKQSSSWTENAMAQLQEWPQPYVEMGATMDEDETASESEHTASSCAEPAMSGKSAGLPGQTRGASATNLESVQNISSSHGNGGPMDGGQERAPGSQPSSTETTPRPSEQRAMSLESQHSTTSMASPNQGSRFGAFCSQKCLLTLKRNEPLDDECPNVALHRRNPSARHHPITVDQLRDTMCRKLSRRFHRDRYIEPLDRKGCFGDVGALLKLTLPRYGYTFLGKGTIAKGVGMLQHEANAYARLESFQGTITPVHLGNIDLKEPYPLLMVDMVHILLMSWAGRPLSEVSNLVGADHESRRLDDLLRRQGVEHRGMRDTNLLWNRENDCFTVIGFDKAVLLDLLRIKRVARLSRSRPRKRRSSPSSPETGVFVKRPRMEPGPNDPFHPHSPLPIPSQTCPLRIVEEVQPRQRRRESLLSFVENAYSDDDQ